MRLRFRRDKRKKHWYAEFVHKKLNPVLVATIQPISTTYEELWTGEHCFYKPAEVPELKWEIEWVEHRTGDWKNPFRRRHRILRRTLAEARKEVAVTAMHWVTGM